MRKPLALGAFLVAAIGILVAMRSFDRSANDKRGLFSESVEPNDLSTSATLPTEHAGELAGRRVADVARGSSPIVVLREQAELMHECMSASRDVDTIIDRQLQLASQRRRDLEGSGIVVDADAEARSVEVAVKTDVELAAKCADFTDSNKSSWINLLRRAADAGDREAKRELVRWAYAEFEESVPADKLEEAADRRDLVRRYAEELVRSGDCDALAQLQWSVVAPAQAYIYKSAFIAFTEQKIAAQGAPLADFSELNAYLTTLRSSGSIVDLDSADAARERLLQNCSE